MERPGASIPIVGLEPGFARCVVLQPVLWIVLVPVVEDKVPVCGRMERDKPKRLAVVRVVILSLCLVRRGWGVINAAGEQNPPTVLLGEPNRVVLVPAVATEVDWVKALVGVPRQELLPVHGNGALSRGLQRGVGVAGAGDKLVQLEREEAPLAVVRAPGPFPLGHTG